MKYNLPLLIKAARPRARRVMIPIIGESIAFEKAYLKQLRRVNQAVAEGCRDIVIPRYGEKLLTMDADASSFNALRLLVNAMVRMVSASLGDLLQLEATRHTKKWLANARSAFGIDLKAVVSEGDLGSFLDIAALRNASLIQGMADDVLKQIAVETTNALLNGESVARLKVRIQERLGVSDARARLIARDQTSKLNADLNQKRHTDAGIDSYVWRTSADERVRPRHRDLEGKTYKYGEPTGAEEGLPPGKPIRCRCIAQAVVEF